MKKLTLLLCSCVCLWVTSLAQNNQNKKEDKGQELATRMADRLRDSLSLSPSQRQAIYEVNLDLHKQKMKAWEKTKDRGVLGKELQKIEDKRDKEYQKFLTDEQYQNYRKKKRNLISAR